MGSHSYFYSVKDEKDNCSGNNYTSLQNGVLEAESDEVFETEREVYDGKERWKT